jgi:hypothetical protein
MKILFVSISIPWPHKISVQQIIGIGCLIISFIIGYLTLLWGEFGDEGAVLAIGGYLAKGQQLYHDIFSHHFPFPYYWSGFIAFVFGKSLVAERLFLLLFQLSILFITMVLTQEYLLIGTLSILWSVIKLFYKGNMLVYSSFSGIALLGLLAISLAILQAKVSPRKSHWITMGVLSVIAVGSDPLSIYPVTVSILFLSLKKLEWGGKLFLIFLSGMMLYLVHLLLTKNLTNFYSNAILFNRIVYSKYTFTDPVRLNLLSYYISNLLELFNKEWLQNINPLYKISLTFTMFDKWFFTGFLYRLAILLASLSLFQQKQKLPALLLYVFAATTLTINKWDFRAQPFILTALYGISAQIILGKKVTNSTPVRIFLYSSQIIIIFLTLWMFYRSTDYLVSGNYPHGKQLFSPYQNAMRIINHLTCNQENVYLAYYPSGNYYYWYSDLQPVSKYVYMWPWVAEIGQQDVLNVLKDKQIKAVVVIQPLTVWGKYNTMDYLKPLIRYIEKRYRKVEDGIYLSPNLVNNCHPKP